MPSNDVVRFKNLSPVQTQGDMPVKPRSELPRYAHGAAGVREMDRKTIEEHGIAGIKLMKRAGKAVFDALLVRWPETQSVTVLCGGGNNGGDGYIVAALAAQRRMSVAALWLKDPEELTGDAVRAYQFAVEAGVAVEAFSGQLPEAGIVVDALLGTGIQGEVKANYRDAIDAINGFQGPIVAVDIPSGLCSDTGCELGAVVEADLTVSFIGIKRGLLTGRGPALTGELLFETLGIPNEVAEIQSDCRILNLCAQLDDLKPRARDAHKGRFGHVLVVGGDSGFGGAPLMAAEAAARMGAGLTSVVTRPEHVAAITARVPEVMVHGLDNPQHIEPLLEAASVVVIGPGLGQSPWSEQLLQRCLAVEKPVVIDADALNLIAAGKVEEGAHCHWILTPHPGEAARLLATTADDVQRDRFAAVQSLAQKWGATVLLKGAGSLIAQPQPRAQAHANEQAEDSFALLPYGNPGMASGGMGDVLSGMIGGLLAQGLSLADALSLAACLHGIAADNLSQKMGMRGLLATDLVAEARRLLNGVAG